MKKGNLSTVILILVLLVGLALLLYPSFSDYWNSIHQSRAIADYAEQIAQMDNSQLEQIWAQAQQYNQTLPEKKDRYEMTDEEWAEYESLLDVSGTGIMGYIEIPLIGCSLPIYHSTDEAVLRIATGHIAGTSLPVGGVGTHSVLSGHRGLPSAKLFTDLDKLSEGDLFMLCIMDEVLTYEVDQILIVLPYEMGALQIDPEQDYCTLVTCTPYAINSHRLLVRGHRVENAEDASTVRVTADATQIEPLLVAPLVAAPILFVLLLKVLFSGNRKKDLGRNHRKNSES